jgi:hypothetical protein
MMNGAINSNHIKIVVGLLVVIIGTWMIANGHHRSALGMAHVDSSTDNFGGVAPVPRLSCSHCPVPACNCTCTIAIPPKENEKDHGHGSDGSSSSSSSSSSAANGTCAASPPCTCPPCAAKAPTKGDGLPSPSWAVGTPDPLHGDRNGTLVIYSYFEDPDPAKPAKQNLEFFVEVGMTPLLNHPHVHFFILVSGTEFTVTLPKADNVFVYRRGRNFGMDICAYSETFPKIDSGEIVLPQKLQKYRYLF